MRNTLIIALIVSLCRLTRADSEPPRRKPNIIFILVDDMGYGDAGCFWQNQRGPGEPRLSTPNLDRMAGQGMMLTSHYSSAPVCAPSRASLMQGLDQGHCTLRDNKFDEPLSPGPTLGSVLQAAGYYTAAIGKWGIGGTTPPWPAHPLKRGFNEFYGFMRHGAAHNHYADNNGTLFDNYSPITQGLDNDYDTDLFTARAKRLIEQHAHQQKPFFLYLAYTLPHFGMQLPPGPFPAGGGLHGGMQWPLDETRATPDSYYDPATRETNWPDNEKRFYSMIHRLDQNVGDVLQTLQDLKIDDNTLVVFTSDNGPHNEGNDPRFFSSWGPFDGIKRDLFEGGMREPTIVRWPGHVPADTKSAEPTVQFDWMATFANLAGLPSPALSDGLSMLPMLTGHPQDQLHHPFLYFEYFGPMTGPITKEILARHGYTKRGQMQAVRLGDMVGVRYQIKKASDPLELYNVVNDQREMHNLAAQPQYASTLAQMRDLLITARDPIQTNPRPYDRELMPAVAAPQKIGGVAYESFHGHWPWIPDFRSMSANGHGVARDFSVPAANGTEFMGYIDVPADGKYVFTADHPADVWLHDALVIRDSNERHRGEIALKAGWHPLRVAVGSEPLKLIFSTPDGTPDQPVSAKMLGYDPRQETPDVHSGFRGE